MLIRLVQHLLLHEHQGSHGRTGAGAGEAQELKWCCSPCSLLTLNRARRIAAQLM